MPTLLQQQFTSARTTDVSMLLDDWQRLRTEWSISKEMAIALVEHLKKSRPRRILEIGSGISTVLLAACAAEYGAQVVTLEHDSGYRQRTLEALKSLGLDGQVDLQLAPLGRRRFQDQCYLWYEVQLEGKFDFVFIDGPPKEKGRHGVFFAIYPHLNPTSWEVWLDDGLRKHEQGCVKLWQRHYAFTSTSRDLDGKGVWVLRGGTKQAPGTDQRFHGRLGGAIVVYGDDAKPLRRMVAEFLDHPLLRTGHTIVAVEKTARMTARALRSLPSVDACIKCQSAETTADRLSRLLAEVIKKEGVRYVLQFASGWSATTLDDTWLPQAIQILEGNPKIEQIRLHRPAEPIRKPGLGLGSRWINVQDRGEEFLRLGRTRFSLEPSLLRVSTLEDASRPADEPIAGRRLLRMKLETAQLIPGVFGQVSADWPAGHSRVAR